MAANSEGVQPRDTPPTDDQIDASLRLEGFNPDGSYPEYGHSSLRAAYRAGWEDRAAAHAKTTAEYRARFSYPSSFLGPASDSYGPPRATLNEALADRVPRSEETHGWRAGVQTREVTAWRETP